jgi:hypothetical protein
MNEVNDQDIKAYFANLHYLTALSAEQAAVLSKPIILEEILAEIRQVTAKRSSPGADGLSYALLYEVFRFPPIQTLLVQVFNQALINQIFTLSWQDIQVRLLPKKGDLTLLKNWRPISLINCDAKIYTRIKAYLGSLNNRYQTGFMPNRSIVDNGLMVQLLTKHARDTSSPSVAVLHDQEKAYDRVHLRYLRYTLGYFGFPSILTDSIISLFFNNRVRVNVNRHFTDCIQ